MKNVKYIILTLVCIVIIGGCIFYIVTDEIPTPKNILDRIKTNPDKSSETVSTESDNKEFVFAAPKVKEAPIESKPAIEKKTVYLYLDNNLYYPVTVPANLEIVTDYNKYIYSKDSTFSVSVISNVSHDELSSYTGIKNAVTLSPSIVRTEEGYKGAQEAAKHVVNDKGIVIRAYNNPEAFATALWSLENKTYEEIASKDITIKKDGKDKTMVLSYIPQKTGYHISMTIGLVDDYNRAYAYEDGILTMAKEFKKFDDAISLLSNRVAIVSGQVKADVYYKSSDMFYVEIGKYTIGVVSVNFNTSITLFGIGEEARFNISSYMKSY